MDQLPSDLVEDLTRRFSDAVRSQLEPEEATFFEELRPPVIDVSTLDGEPCIRISVYGTESRIGWDGTAADALDCVLSCVDSTAASISDDYWMTGGWRTRTSFPPA